MPSLTWYETSYCDVTYLLQVLDVPSVNIDTSVLSMRCKYTALKDATGCKIVKLHPRPS